MNVNELTSIADKARERHEATRDRGHQALVALTAARASLTTAEAAQIEAEQALDGLAAAHLAGTPATEKAISAALSGIAAADGQLRFRQAVLGAAQRALQAVSDEQQDADRAAVSTAEQAHRARFEARIEALAAGHA